MSAKGSLTVVSGFSGVGKGTVMKSLLDRYEGYALSISATTRAPRPGEQHGVEYFFITKEAFEELIASDGLVEYAQYCENYYGTPRAFVEQQLSEGKDLILEIEIQGAMKVRRIFPDAALVFVMPPDTEALMQRLRGRGTESREVIDQRIRRAAREAEGIEDYDYILINDEIDHCADELHNLIRARKMRTDQNLDFVRTIREDIRTLNERIEENNKLCYRKK